MSSVTVELPPSLKDLLEQMAKELNVSVADLLVDAVEKISQVDTLERISQRAIQRNTRAAFEKVLAAVPDVEPRHPNDAIKD